MRHKYTLPVLNSVGPEPQKISGLSKLYMNMNEIIFNCLCAFGCLYRLSVVVVAVAVVVGTGGVYALCSITLASTLLVVVVDVVLVILLAIIESW